MKKDIANKWFEAFNAHDLNKLLELYHENAKHYSPKLKLRQPETNGHIIGKESLRDWWQDSFKRLPSLRYIPNFMIEEDGKIFMEYTRKVDGEGDIVVGELLCIENELIVESKVYHS